MRNKRGFTLVELMIVVCITGILAVIGGPAINSYLEVRGLSAAANRLRGDMQLAKLEAIKQNANCTLTFTPTSYSNNLTGKAVNLTQFRGVVTLGTDPGAGTPGSATITFRPDGWSTAVGAVYVYSQAVGLNKPHRLRVTIAGGISQHVWNNATSTWLRL